MANGYPRGWKHVVKPYHSNPDICVVFELEFKNDTIKPGDKIRFKNERGLFTFQRLAHNQKLGTTWIDCTEDATRQFRSFRVDRLKLVVRPKKSRRKKQTVAE